jgi:hypothetical protein
MDPPPSTSFADERRGEGACEDDDNDADDEDEEDDDEDDDEDDGRSVEDYSFEWMVLGTIGGGTHEGS